MIITVQPNKTNTLGQQKAPLLVPLRYAFCRRKEKIGSDPIFYELGANLENKLIELHPFNEIDFSKLIAEIPDARFLLQWAGPKYTYPLDAAQLSGTLAKTIEGKPSHQVFKAIRKDTSETVGHIQLMDIDCDAVNCVLGRVLIFQNYQGNGFGKAMVQTAIRFAFENLYLAEVTLGVFDFNTAAIDTYKSIGFSEFQFNKGARQFQNESWNVIKMKLNISSWLHRNVANHGIE